MSASIPQIDAALVRRLANTVRGLSIDAVQKANSGHPGLPLGCADLAATLWLNFLRYDPSDPAWPNRDRFILSAGHGSMLLYSLLHLAGYEVAMDDLKAFRQWGSSTPGHPELHITPGVEATTGPLGQGLSNAVGVALSGLMLRDRFADKAPGLFDHFVYVLASDGDLMEGVASEACSLAGEWRLSNLIVLYDDNSISLDGPTSLSFSAEDPVKRFESYGWQVLRADGHDPESVAKATLAAQQDPRPSLIACKTVIGYGSPNKAGSSKAHGSPLGAEEVALTKEKLGIPAAAFHVPAEDRDVWAARARANREEHAHWKARLAEFSAKHPEAFAEYEALRTQKTPAAMAKDLPAFDPAKSVATRRSSKDALNAIAKHASWLVGGSADLSSSTNAVIDGTTRVKAGDYKGRDLYFGVREHAMGAIANGLTSQGFFRCFTATFLTFSDYMRPAIRLAALSNIPSIFVFTHDSVFLGEDGPTHQPVEHYAALRSIPNLVTLRPGDAAESAQAWLFAVEEKHHPSCLLFTRQNLPVFDRKSDEFNPADGLRLGAYVLRPEKGDNAPDLVLIATGSELHLAVEAARKLEAEGLRPRVVSMPSMELFREQDAYYRDSVLPPAVSRRLVVESGVSLGWHEWAGSKGELVTLDRFGSSAPDTVLAAKFGFTVEAVASRARDLMRRG
ncbi:MAG: transketolase [Candidatus Sumerlaeia bacterium]|nr:transketolase [Candidatus Sumerlaeia bacterium]